MADGAGMQMETQAGRGQESGRSGPQREGLDPSEEGLGLQLSGTNSSIPESRGQAWRLSVTRASVLSGASRMC